MLDIFASPVIYLHLVPSLCVSGDFGGCFGFIATDPFKEGPETEQKA